MALIEKIYPKYSTCSIIGMSKNVGKTFTLNHLIDEADAKGMTIGITSIGRDGERIDVVTETDKPTIFLPEGNFVTTASGLLEISEATVALEKVLPFNTPLGEVILGRVVYDGYVQISGPQTLRQTEIAAREMLDLGADFVIIDGALDRKTSAAPEITECTILATGASYNRNMDTVVKETAHIARLFHLPVVENHREILTRLIKEESCGLVDEKGEGIIVPIETSLGAGAKIADNIRDHHRYLVIPGALTVKTVEDIITNYGSIHDITIVVNDPTKIFIDQRNALLLGRRGLNIEVLNRSELVAITANPFAPEGYYFDGYEFIKQLREAIPDVEVIDLMLGD